jgi:hypothetical protein
LPTAIELVSIYGATALSGTSAEFWSATAADTYVDEDGDVVNGVEGVRSVRCVLRQPIAQADHYAIAADTVRDNRTQLIWQRAVAQQAMEWAVAVSYCQMLDLGGFSSGWRLPRLAELLSVVDFSSSTPGIDVSAFPNIPQDYFWTASAAPASGPPAQAHVVGFGPGESRILSIVPNVFHVRCVHNGT